MAEIRNRQNNPRPGIDYSEIYIPNDQDLGTGTYTTVLQPNALAKKDPIMSLALNAPVFQISVNINPATEEIPVLLGKADGSPPISRKVFNLPQNIELTDAYTFEARFENWQVTELTLNGVSLHMQIQPGTVTFWVDPTKNPGAFTQGKGYIWGVFEVNGEDVSEGNTLSATLNKDTDREIMIFSTQIISDPSSAHMIAVTWSDEEMNLYFDAESLTIVKMSDFFAK